MRFGKWALKVMDSYAVFTGAGLPISLIAFWQKVRKEGEAGNFHSFYTGLHLQSARLRHIIIGQAGKGTPGRRRTGKEVECVVTGDPIGRSYTSLARRTR